MHHDHDSLRFRRAFILSASFVVLLWLIKAYEWLSGSELFSHGVYPRDPAHLYGILVAPLLHGSAAHLAANSPALLVLGTSTLYGYPRAARLVIPLIWLGSGIGVWYYARSAFHLGASGLTFGLMFFVFTIGALRWDPRASALSMLVFFLYGGMIWGIFPTSPDISFEYHFFGAAIGVLSAIALRRLDPAPPARRYSWELESDAEHEDTDAYWLAPDRDTDPATPGPPDRSPPPPPR